MVEQKHVNLFKKTVNEKIVSSKSYNENVGKQSQKYAIKM